PGPSAAGDREPPAAARRACTGGGRATPGAVRDHQGRLEREAGAARRAGLARRGARRVMQVADGTVVTLEYTVHLADGTLLDSTAQCGPLAVRIGSAQLFPALEPRILGMEAGETRTLTIPAADAYGEWRAELVRPMPRDRLPPDLELEVGREYRLKSP